MISIQIAGFVIDVVQTYMIFNFLCKIWKPRHGVALTNFLLIGISLFAYLKQSNHIVNIIGNSPVILSCINTVAFVVYVYLLTEGSLWQSIKRSIFTSSSLLLLEICITPFVNLVLFFKLLDLKCTEDVVLGKIIYTLIMYLVMLILESIIYWKKNQRLNVILISCIIFAVCELGIFMVLIYSMGEEKIKYLIGVSSIYAIIVLLSYFVMTNMGYEMVRQQKKKNEMEQRLLEKQYQYDYYILAKEKAEQVRDLRHDMRNQLQTVQYLMSSETEDEKKHAREMLENLEEKVMGLMMEDEL